MRIGRLMIAVVSVLCLAVFAPAAYAEELVLPSDLLAIEEQAFYGDSSLDTVVLPEGIQTIGRRAFAHSSIKEINLPRSLKSIAENAFVGCDQLVIDAPIGSLGWNYAMQHGFELKHNISGSSIRLFNGQIGLADSLERAAKVYENATGLHVEVESLGGGVDLQATLKQYYQAGHMPDIFVCHSESDFGNWTGMMADMSDEAWARDTDMGYRDSTGALVGFPFTMETIGLAYNKDILQRAGVDPDSITDPASMKAAFKIIDAQKDRLGITAVIGYCTNARELYWSTGQHLFGNYLDAGLDREDTRYFDLLMKGKLDTERFTHFAEMVDLFNRYSDPALLVSGNYDKQVSGFAAGKYAFVTQGSWIGPSLTSAYRNQYATAGYFECGFIPYCFEKGIDTILANAPSWWVVYNGGNVAEAEEFLNWLAGPDGQKIMVEEGGCVSPFKSSNYITDDPFFASVSYFNKTGKTSAWHWMGQPANLAQDYTGPVFQDFAMGVIDVQEFVEDMAFVIQKCIK